MTEMKHCTCEVPAPFTTEELTPEVAAALLLEWAYVPQPGPTAACSACRLPIADE